MALNKTKYGRKRVLDHFFGKIEHPFPADVYLALFTSDPTDAGLQTSEIAQTGYTRIEISALFGNADLPTGIITNTAVITFGPATQDWSEIAHVGVMDAITAGNMIYFGPAVTSRLVQNGDDFQIKPGQITIQER